jgi:colicin import membrane protein
MVQAGWRRVLGSLCAVALLGLGGCSSGRSSTRVDEEWLARVPPAQMEEVRKARLTQDKARDETVRAEVGVEDAKRELEVARRNEEAAKARREVDEAAVTAARETALGADILQAQRRLREADLELAAAQAETAFREQTVRTRQALEQMRARELAVAEAELAQTEYQALLRSGDVRARRLSAADFADALAKARSEAWETQREVDALLQRQRQAQARWQQLDAQTQAYGGSGRQ